MRLVSRIIILMVLSTNIDQGLTFECTGFGSVPKPPVNGCVDYIICSVTSEKQKLAKDFSCPFGTVFNKTSFHCETNECSFENRTMASQPVLVTRKPKAFICTSKGRYANPVVPDCGGYVFCSRKSRNKYVQYHFTCPKSQKFDPISKKCSKAYKCPKPITKFIRVNPKGVAKQPVSVANRISCPDSNRKGENDIAKCPDTGRFPDPTTIGCKGYIICSILANRTMVRSRLLCSGDSLFDPFTKTCQVNYVCNEPTKTNEIAQEPIRLVTTSTTTTRAPVYFISTTTQRQTIILNTIPRIEAQQSFICPSVGRFLDGTVPGCKGYILCTNATPGRFGRYSCLGETTFNPATQQCTKNYKCPY